jgi:hypothetical protein
MNPIEVVKRGEEVVIKRARGVFRESLVPGYSQILMVEDISKIEHWFITRSLESYGVQVKTRILVDSGRVILNYSSLVSLYDLYSTSAERWYGFWESHEVGKRERILSNLTRRIEESERTILEFPDELEKIRETNRRISRFADRTIKPAVEKVFGGVGEAGGFAVMVMGLTSGAVGYVVGKTIRTSGEAVIRRLTKGSGG